MELEEILNHLQDVVIDSVCEEGLSTKQILVNIKNEPIKEVMIRKLLIMIEKHLDNQELVVKFVYLLIRVKYWKS